MGIIPEGKADNLEGQTDNLRLSIKEFIRCIYLLPDVLFHEKMDDWTPRDVTAHLIGWNLYTVEGCHQIRKGETPFYFIDPGEDFSKVNAALVRKYDSQDKNRLIDQIKTSAEKLKQFTLDLDRSVWEADYGVTYKGEPVTIKNSIDMLIYDYDTHRKKIEQWAENANNLDG